jgi:hypothetical protein
MLKWLGEFAIGALFLVVPFYVTVKIVDCQAATDKK